MSSPISSGSSIKNPAFTTASQTVTQIKDFLTNTLTDDQLVKFHLAMESLKQLGSYLAGMVTTLTPEQLAALKEQLSALDPAQFAQLRASIADAVSAVQSGVGAGSFSFSPLSAVLLATVEQNAWLAANGNVSQTSSSVGVSSLELGTTLKG